jgi:MraZ protein
MFRGRYEHTVDAKGRIALPARFREVLAQRYEDEHLIITLHLTDPCLVIYPRLEFEAFEERLGKMSTLDPRVTILRRQYVGKAQDCEIDKQGRLLIPTDLRRDAKIDHGAVWSGSVRFLELWAKEAYATHVEAVREKLAQGEMPDVLEKLAELGI